MIIYILYLNYFYDFLFKYEAINKMDHSSVYVSLSTIPSRFKNIKKTILSLLRQTVLPKKIIVNIPVVYKRFKDTVKEKDIEKLKRVCGPMVHVHRTNDYGPGTKLLGALEIIPSDSYVLLVDDDIMYHPETLETFIESGVMEQGNAASMSVYHLSYTLLSAKGFTIGQGWNGFFVPGFIKEDIFTFYDIIKDEERVFFDDDIWISYYLNKKGVDLIPVEKRKHTEYNISDGLKYITWYQMFEPALDYFYTRTCITNIYKLDHTFSFIKGKGEIHRYDYTFLVSKIIIYMVLIYLVLLLTRVL